MPPAHPLPQIAGAYYVRVEGQADAKPVSNVLTFLRQARPTPDPDDFAAATALATNVAAGWSTLASDCLHTVYTGNEVVVYALNSPLMPAIRTGLAAPGGRIGAQSFIQVAGVVKHVVSRRGKGSQSRTFLSPLSDSDITVNGDQVTAGWVTRADADWFALINNTVTAMNAAFPGPWSYVQLSKQTFGGVYGKIFGITASSAETLISSQRRRLGR